MGTLNILNDAENKFNDLLSKISATTYENDLQYYDNVTYNIRLYMINNAAEIYLGRLVEKGYLNNYIIPDDEKIIIAETGKSSKLSINSLTLNTIHANTCNSHSATTSTFEIVIKENNGCQLINQITAVSKLLGYENHIGQPYHLDIWFSGYENLTHKPIKIIPEVGVLNYKIIMNQVKTNIDSSGTTYNFMATNAGLGSVSKEIIAVGDKGIFKEISGLTLELFAQKLENELNKSYFEQNEKYLKYYNDNKYINIRLIDAMDENIDKDWTKPYCSPSLKNSSLLTDIFIDANDYNLDSGFKPESNATLFTVFQDFCLNSDNLREYIARPIFRIKPMENVDGLELSKICVDVIFSTSQYLKSYISRFEDFSNKSPSDLREYNFTTAFYQLLNIAKNGKLKKKYQWLFNGKDTSVLEINSTIDRLWYSNIPLWDVKENLANVSSIFNRNMANVLENKVSNGYKSKDELMSAIKKELNKSNTIVNGIKTMAGDKRLYLEDIYNCIDDKSKRLLLNERVVTEKVLPYNESQPSSSVSTNDKPIIAKIGYNNIFANGLQTLQFKILGDPYWLQLCSDECLYGQNMIDSGMLTYFIFKMNTCSDQKPNGTYDLENVVDFTNIYQIIESKSIFENGAFIQNIKAIIAPEFLTLGRLEI